jgi:hypothetical protein
VDLCRDKVVITRELTFPSCSAPVSSCIAWPPREALKSPKWSPHPPLAQSMASDLESEAEAWFPPSLVSTGTFAGGGVCTWRGREGALPRLLWWGERSIPLVLLSPASEKRGIRYRWHPCTFSMIRVEDPGSSFMLYLGPGPSSMLCMTRANET